LISSTMPIPISKERFLGIAAEEAADLGEELGQLNSVLEFIYEYPVVVGKRAKVDLSAAPDEGAVRKYLKDLLRSHFAKRKAKISLNEVQTVPDPAVDAVLEAFGNVPRGELKAFSEHHRSSMAAENKIGDLLEAYLAKVLEPRGWVWCCGHLLIGVDFFRPAANAGGGVGERFLLQVKNRSNSENSSSKRIRELVAILGCPVKITEWHRCRASDGGTCWDALVENEDLSLADEERFHDFVRQYPRE
jgi:hypothetical protein